MHEPLFGYSFLSILLIVVIGAAYIVTLIMLGWESHTKYGTGYYWVGLCLAGAVGAYFNYKHYLGLQALEDVNYPLWMMIVVNVIISLLGLWMFLIFHAIVLKKTKGMRSGARLVKRVLAAEVASTGTGRFRKQLRGWEGDTRLDMLIVEKNFILAEDYLQGVIMKASNERESQKVSLYEQYRTIIQMERLAAESTSPSRDVDNKRETQPKESIDLKRSKKVDEDTLPEGWKVQD